MKKMTIGELKEWIHIFKDDTIVYLENDGQEKNVIQQTLKRLSSEDVMRNNQKIENAFASKKNNSVKGNDDWWKEKEEKNPFMPVPKGPEVRKKENWWE